MKVECFGSVLLLSLFVVSSAPAKIIDRVAAVVNNDVILLSEVDSRCQAALDEIPSTLPLDEIVERKREIRSRALDDLIDELLLRQKVREHKIEVSEEEVEKQIEQLMRLNNLTKKQFEEALKLEGRTLAELKREFRGQLERQKLIDIEMRNNPELRAQVQVGEKDIADYYRDHYQAESSQEKVRASHILFIVSPDASKEDENQVRVRAREVLNALKKGAAFDEMAKKHSDDPSSSLGGDLGWFRRGDMMASFEKAAFGLKKGQLSGLVRTKLGYHIIKVTDRAVEGPPPVDKVRNEIRSKLYRQKFREAVTEWLEQLKRRSHIEKKL